MIYKTLKKVSNVCQVLDKRTYPAAGTENGITFTHNGDGSYTANGTYASSSGSYFYFCDTANKNLVKLVANHKYLILNGTYYEAGTYSVWLIVNNSLMADSNSTLLDNNFNAKTYTPKKNEEASLSIDITHKPNVDTINFTFKPQLFDLTEMYGAGNEPTTVEQFRQDFPEELYDYKPYCFVKSYKTLLKASNFCQLLDKSKYPATQTIYGVTFTNNGDGSITVNGTCTNLHYSAYKIKENLDGIISGHKYAILGTGTNMSVSFSASYQGGYIWKVSNNIFTLPENEYTVFSSQIRVTAGVSVSNITVKPQIFDLTEMYGAGNEPTTVEQFREKFPNELYDYKPYSIITSYKKSLVCKTKNLFPTSTAVGTLGEWNQSTARQFEENKWYIGISGSNYYIPSNISEYKLTENYVYINTKGSGYGIGRAFKCEPNQTYTISCKWVENTNYMQISIGFYDGNGNYLSYNAAANLAERYTVTIPANCKWFTVCFVGNSSGSSYVYNIQLELGNTATEYHPYGYL